MNYQARIVPALAALLLALAQARAISQPSPPKNPVQKSGKYAVELRVPPEGLFAEEEVDVELRVTDTSQDDPVQGPPPVVNAKVAADVWMPSMPGMPRQKPKTHAEGVPGDYGVLLFFPHGGEYSIDLTITPPSDKPFKVSFKVPVKDPLPPNKRKPKPQPYVLEVKSRPSTPRAGEPAELRIFVRQRADKKQVTEFDIVHEQKMHFIIVSKDLSHFAHEHPESGDAGKFTLHYTFPAGGEYRLFADVAPRGAGSQVVSQAIRVAGAARGPIALTPSSMPAMSAGGVKLALQNKADDLAAGRTHSLTFTARDEKTGAPIKDFQPWLGAVAHLILIHQDASTFVHSHPDESDPENGKGQITFLARFPKPGIYRGWLQFQRAGKVETAQFTVAAKG